MLRADIAHLDAILITHEHNDHVIGLDDVRPFNFMTGRDMEVYATSWVQEQLRVRFGYVFAANPYPGAPRVHLVDLDPESTLELKGVTIQPIRYLHGRLPVIGFRIGSFAYLTDIKTIEDAELEKVIGVDTLVISALHRNPHHSHLNLDEALDLIEKIAPRQAYLTHMSHRMGFHQEVDDSLPEGVNLGYDGLRILID